MNAASESQTLRFCLVSTFYPPYNFGGDGIYAAWQTVNNEPAFKDTAVGWGVVPVAERLQKNFE